MSSIEIIAGLVSAVVARVWPDKTEQEKEVFTLELVKEINANNLLSNQLDVDKAEANNPNIFVSGWRPWIGWGLGTIIIFYAFFTLIINFMIALHINVLQFPPLDPMVANIVLGLLGMNIGSRTFEKWKGVNHKHR